MYDYSARALLLVLTLAATGASAATVDAEAVDRGSELAYRRALAPGPDARRINADSVTRARRIANRLVVGAANMDADAKRFSWAVNVVSSPVPDVRAFPGGRIVITDGIIDRAGLADEELGAVIAYALSHAVLRHETARVVPPTRSDSIDPNRVLLDYADAVTAAMRNVRYTPAEIADADRMSIEMLARAAYDPRAAVNAWRRLSAGGKGIVEASPVNDERIAALETAIRTAAPLYEETRARAEAYARSQRPRPPPRITGQEQRRDPFVR